MLALRTRLPWRRRPEAELESMHRFVASLGKLKGVAMKLGQDLSYFESTLSEDLRAALSALQTHSQPMSVARVTKILHAELGPAARPIVDTLEPTPLSAASIGQVHRARLPDGTPVAVKVQYPGITKAIQADFGPASVAARAAGWLYPSWPVESLMREAKARALDECDYRAEARHQAVFAARYVDHDMIAIPAVHEAYCSERVLVTTLAQGSHLGEWLAGDPSQDRRNAIGQALVIFYVGSALRWNLLPGDPHPGNYLITREGRLAIVDHGCTCIVEGSQARPVLEAADERAAQRAAAELGGDALLPLRVRLGIAGVLAQIGVRRSWRELAETAAAPLPAKFDVVLVAPGERIIEIVREVRDLTGANIRDAKDLVEQTPRVLRTTSDRKEAEALKRRLEISGGVVEIRGR
jgi:predicted unusual protein kinase regulating ubiquinone biosynthesis (AarF/ABC1/UbiB family)/ribosomal protein L7/L12